MNNNKRIVVTGLGVVSSLGTNKNTFWRNLVKGKSGISKITSFDASNFRTHYGGEVKRSVNLPNIKNRTSKYLLKAILEAKKDSKLNFSAYKRKDIGLTLGSIQIDHPKIEHIHNYEKNNYDAFFPIQEEFYKNSFLDALKMLNIGGPALNFVTLCSAGNYAIGAGSDLLRNDKAKAVFCCGADSISRFLQAGFNRLLISSPDKCSPFDKNRKGMIVGEGAGVLVLETLENALKRKAQIYAEVLGYSLSCDAYSMTMPSFKGIYQVMKNAIKKTKLGLDQVDYINAHGTGTLSNDIFESKAINKLFGKYSKKIDVTSIKSMLGHPISASSAIEAVSCCLSIRDKIIPPTINYKTRDPECDIKVVANKARKRNINIVLNNSFAFGGNNACVVFAKYKK